MLLDDVTDDDKPVVALSLALQDSRPVWRTDEAWSPAKRRDLVEVVALTVEVVEMDAATRKRLEDKLGAWYDGLMKRVNGGRCTKCGGTGDMRVGVRGPVCMDRHMCDDVRKLVRGGTWADVEKEIAFDSQADEIEHAFEIVCALEKLPDDEGKRAADQIKGVMMERYGVTFT